MLLEGGEEIECGAAVGIGWEKFFDDGDLSANFGGVGRLGGSAAEIVLWLRLLCGDGN